MENREKGEVVEGKDTSTSCASRDSNLPQEGLPSGDRQAIGSCSQLSWELEVGSPETLLLPLVLIHPSQQRLSIPSYCQCNHITTNQSWFGRLGPLSFTITQLTVQLCCRRLGNNRAPALPTMIMPRHKLFFISSGLQWDHNPWH